MTKRVAIYARVSTTRQAKHDISIPDQIKQAKKYCGARGWYVAREFVDPGASARDDKRPQFQAMMDKACVDPHLSRIDADVPAFRQTLSKQQAASLAVSLQHRLLDAPKALKRRYVHGLVSEIIVDHEKTVITGPRAAIAATVTSGKLDSEVRSFVRDWRTGADRTVGVDGPDGIECARLRSLEILKQGSRPWGSLRASVWTRPRVFFSCTVLTMTSSRR